MAVQVWQNDLSDLASLELLTRSAEQTVFLGRPALRLDGLALVPGLELLDGSIEVSIAAEGPCYPGIAFGVRDAANYELAYAVPHCSGQSDAIQYDPVFHGSNTWQLYHGPCYQQTAAVPTGEWFTLRIHVNAGRASIQLDDSPPLVVDQLAHPHLPGQVGLWTYRPALFAGLRILSNGHPVGQASPLPSLSPGTVREWFMEGYGPLQTEAGGFLNLNRYFPATLGEAVLTRRFELVTACPVTFGFGFSDELSLWVDGQECYGGANLFKGFDSYADRGWVRQNAQSVTLPLQPGIHELKARLKVREGFGWGLNLQAQAESAVPFVTAAGPGMRWLPATRGSG
jgi:hypothetical protein